MERLASRHLYVAMFALPSLLAALVVALVIFGAAAGGLWLFVFGDNPWPAGANTALAAAFVLTLVSVWGALLRVAYVAGRNAEMRKVSPGKPVLLAAGATALLIAFVALHQWSVGNLGSRGTEESCAAFCRDRGFAGSGTPPRNAAIQTCTCFDGSGREVVKVPLAGISPPRR